MAGPATLRPWRGARRAVAEAVAEVLADLPDDQGTTAPDRTDPADGDEIPS